MKIDCDVNGKTVRKSESVNEKRGGNVMQSEKENEKRKESSDGGGEAEVGHEAEGQGHEVEGQDRGVETGGEEAEVETEIEIGTH